VFTREQNGAERVRESAAKHGMFTGLSSAKIVANSINLQVSA
jgi:hypothetical protein